MEVPEHAMIVNTLEAPQDIPQPDDLLYDAWNVIANAPNGAWNDPTTEWYQAAVAWRDKWHTLLWENVSYYLLESLEKEIRLYGLNHVKTALSLIETRQNEEVGIPSTGSSISDSVLP